MTPEEYEQYIEENDISEEEIRQAEKQRDWETRYYTERDYGGRL